MLGEGTKTPLYPHISVGEGLVPSRVSGSEVGVITTGGHKILPYDVVVIGAGVKAFRRGLLPAVCRLLYSFTW
jgi:hypothetical protein